MEKDIESVASMNKAVESGKAVIEQKEDEIVEMNMQVKDLKDIVTGKV